MQKATYKDRFQYWFDNVMARGTPALIGLLTLVAAVFILFVALLDQLIGIAPVDANGGSNFLETAWDDLNRALAPDLGGDAVGQWPLRMSLLVLAVVGIFLVSSLVGILTTGLDSRLESLRKGRSRVLETDHTLILGWSDQVFILISELVIANASQRRPCIVILADKDKAEMDEEIHTKLGSTGKTRVITRSGNPLDLDELEIVNPQGSRSIIALSPDAEEPDAHVIKTLLAITNNPRRRPEPYHIVAAIRDVKNMEAARLVGGTEAQLVEVGDTISRLVAQTCRQSGLSVVYTELLDFDGDEIYFREEAALVGKTFGDAQLAYEDCAVLGLQRPGGAVQLKPPMDTVIAASDKLILIAEDDDKIKLSGLTDLQIDTGAIREATPVTPAAERILVLGWNHRAPAIINELDNYVAPQSEIRVVADASGAGAEIASRCAGLRNLTVDFQEGDTTDRRTLDSLNLHEYQHIIVLCYADMLDVQRADARTLITLLHLRDIENRVGEHYSIVSEMLDDRNRALAEVTQADDFIVSDRLISLMLSQISENKYLTAVFADLFDPEGAEIYLKPAQEYVELGHPVNFYTVVEAARRRGQVAIGYKRQKGSAEGAKAYGVVVNPDKSPPLTFAEGDRVIVVAEE